MVEYHTFNVRVSSSSLDRLTFIEYTKDAKKNYDLLSLREKSILFLEAIRNNITNIEAIKEAYNKRYYNDGGPIYTVLKHDNLTKIAKNLGINLLDLIGANPQLKDINKIYIGDKLNLPKASQNILRINSDKRLLETNPYSRLFADTVYMMKDSDFNRINGTNISSTNPEGTVLIGKNKDGLTVVGSHFALPTANVSVMSPKKLRLLVQESYTNEDAKIALNNYIAVNGHNIPKDILELLENFLLKSKVLPMYYNNPDLKKSASGLIYFNKEADILRDIDKLNNNLIKAELIAARTGAAYLTKGFSEFALPTAPLVLNMLDFEDSAKKVADVYQASSLSSYVDNPYVANLLNLALRSIGTGYTRAMAIPMIAAEVGATAGELSGHDSLARLLRATLGLVFTNKTLKDFNSYLKNNYWGSSFKKVDVNSSKYANVTSLNYKKYGLTKKGDDYYEKVPKVFDFHNNKVLGDARIAANIGGNYAASEAAYLLADWGLLNLDLLSLVEMGLSTFFNKSRVADRTFAALVNIEGGRSLTNPHVFFLDFKNLSKEYKIDLQNYFKSFPSNLKAMWNGEPHTLTSFPNFFKNGYTLVTPKGLNKIKLDDVTKNISASHFLPNANAEYNIVNGKRVDLHPEQHKTSFVDLITGGIRYLKVGDEVPYGTLVGRNDKTHIIEFNDHVTIGSSDVAYNVKLPENKIKVLGEFGIKKSDDLLTLGKKETSDGKVEDVIYNAGGAILEVVEYKGKRYCRIKDNTQFHIKQPLYRGKDLQELSRVFTEKGMQTSLDEDMKILFKEALKATEGNKSSVEYGGYTFNIKTNSKGVVNKAAFKKLLSEIRRKVAEETLVKRNSWKDVISNVAESTEESVLVRTLFIELDKFVDIVSKSKYNLGLLNSGLFPSNNVSEPVLDKLKPYLSNKTKN